MQITELTMDCYAVNQCKARFIELITPSSTVYSDGNIGIKVDLPNKQALLSMYEAGLALYVDGKRLSRVAALEVLKEKDKILKGGMFS